MRSLRTTSLVGLAAFTLGFWTACSIGFDPTSSDAVFSCETDSDCISPNQCSAGICQRGTVECTDVDGDGYGVGDTTSCPECLSANKCAEDCDDNDAAINPGLQDTCDGTDNDCDGEVDEPLECEDSLDCPEEGGTPPDCEDGTCVYRPTNQLGECSGITLACVAGERETPPDQCQ